MNRYLRIHNLKRRIEEPARVKYCDSFLCRLRGFTFRSRIEPDEGLLLVQARDARLDTAIHMLFVPFELAVIWIDTSLTVVDKVLAKPWRLAYLPARPARYILEIHPDRWEDYQATDEVEFQYV
jgi:uncharacterized membrane protein (UPF0127 family)